MLDSKLSKACPVEEAIRLLRIPDDAATYVIQLSNFDPAFPRRFAFGQVQVVPLQLARFLVETGVGHLLDDGPCAYMNGADQEAEEPEDSDEDDDEDDEEDDVEEPEHDDGRPPRRGPRRRR